MEVTLEACFSKERSIHCLIAPSSSQGVLQSNIGFVRGYKTIFQLFTAVDGQMPIEDR
jgi:hypothetical protein